MIGLSDEGVVVMQKGRIAGRYRLDEEIGRGGMGVVYRGYDLVLDRPVAVKVMFDRAAQDEQTIARFLREARAAARLSHPNIVAVFDAGECDDETQAPFIVMQYVDGPSLREVGDISMAQVVDVAAQICDALHHAHTHGIVHRDVKPGNVILARRDDGSLHAMLADFGLAWATGQVRLTREGAIVGTATYLAPEQALGGEVSGLADLYSLGVMLYELLAGRPPFTGSSPLAVISQHIHAPVVPPRTFNSSIPERLEEIVLRLLAKRPEERFPGAADVADALREVLRGVVEGPSRVEVTGAEDVSSSAQLLQRIARGRLAGRRTELNELIGHWIEARRGSGRLVLISGEPGIGKTRLAQELKVYARLNGGLALEGRCYEHEMSVPYLPFVQILGAMGRECPECGGDLANLPLAMAPAVTEAPFSGAGAVPRPGAEPAAVVALDAEIHRLQLFEGVAAVLAKASESRPVLLLIDDLHWADEASVAMLGHIVRVLQDRPVMVLATYREVELSGTGALDDLLVALNRERLAYRLSLRRLSRSDVAEMVAAIFGMEEAPPELVDPIFQETDGNPFFVEEVVKSLVEEGKVERIGDRWVVHSTTLEIPQSIRAAIGRRLARLSEPTRRMLTLASGLGGGFTFELLMALTGHDEDTLLDLLDEALAAQVLEEGYEHGHERYKFCHALIGQTLYEGLSLRRRVRLHRRIVEAMEQVYAGEIDAHAEELAHHAAQSARTPKEIEQAVEYLLAAARHAAAIFALEDQRRHLEEAIELLENADFPALECRVLECLGDGYYMTFDYVRAVHSYEQALEVWESDPGREVMTAARLHRKIADLGTRWAGVHVREMREKTRYHIAAGLDMLEGARPNSEKVYLLVDASLTETTYLPEEDVQPDYARAEELARRAVEIAETLGEPHALSAALDALGNVLVRQGRIRESSEVQLRRLPLLEHLTDTVEQADLHSMVSSALDSLGRVPEALYHAQEAFRLYGKGGFSQVYLYAAEKLIVTSITADRFRDALELTEQVLRELEDNGVEPWPPLYVYGAIADAWMGDDDGAEVWESRARASLDVFEAKPTTSPGVYARLSGAYMALAWLEMVRRRWERLYEYCQMTLRYPLVGLSRALALALQGQAAARLGDSDGYRHVESEFEREVEDKDLVRWATYREVMYGLRDLYIECDAESAIRRFQKASSEFHEQGIASAEALALLDLADAHLALGGDVGRAGAVDALRRAGQLFDGIGAAGYVRFVGDRLRDLGA